MMEQCPKCGFRAISGPRYEPAASVNGFWVAERLRYTCYLCGYSDTTLCLDADRRELPQKKEV